MARAHPGTRVPGIDGVFDEAPYAAGTYLLSGYTPADTDPRPLIVEAAYRASRLTAQRRQPGWSGEV